MKCRAKGCTKNITAKAAEQDHLLCEPHLEQALCGETFELKKERKSNVNSEDIEPELSNSNELESSSFDSIRKLSEAELLKFLLIDTEVRSLIKDIRIVEQEQFKDDTEYSERKHKRAQQDSFYRAERRQKESELKGLINKISERFGIPVDFIAVDDRTGVVRDLRTL
jgi:hypothetical protein